jgi:hypothetical protein
VKPLAPKDRAEIRRQVDGFLRRNANYGRLPEAQQAEIRDATCKVVERMATDSSGRDGTDPYAIALGFSAPATGRDPYATALGPEDAEAGKVVGDAGKLLKGQGSQLGDAIAVGVTQAARMVKEINFPEFVSGLISGTFHAIVSSSIEQMKAYAEMVKSVATSLNDFKDKNTTDNQARDHLVQKYPRLMQISIVNGEPRIQPRDDYEGEVPDFGRDLGLDESITSLDEDVIEERLVPAARDDLARGRQQLLATTILMGINRIIITDGKINAKIRFNFSVNEKRQMSAQAFDYVNMGRTNTSQGEYESSYEGGSYERDNDKYSRQDGSYYSTGKWQYASTPDVKVTSEVNLSSDANIQAAGQIMGEVSVNFKSESFPLERMVDTGQLLSLQNAQGAGRGALPAPQAAAPGAAAPAAAPAAR